MIQPRIARRAALAGLLALAACSGGPRPTPVATRVISLSPSTTEAVFAIGAGDALVGRSSYCDYPPEALALPPPGLFDEPVSGFVAGSGRWQTDWPWMVSQV